MKLGFEIEIEDVYDIHFQYPVDHDRMYPTHIPGIKATLDGSLRNGIELVSDPLPDIEFASFLYKYTYESILGTYSERCGFHFHMDFEDQSKYTRVSFLSRYLRLERTLFRIYPHLFRSHNNFCNLLLDSPSELTLIRKFATRSSVSLDEFSKYSALNIKPLQTIGTIEFRAAPGGLTPDNATFLFSLFNDIYHDTISPDLLSQVTLEDAAEAEAVIHLINTDLPRSSDELGDYMNTHFDIVPVAPITAIPTPDSIRQFLQGLS
jgi:hypothetical protein